MCLKLTLLYNSSVDVSFDVCVQDAWLIVTFQVAPSRHLFLGKILSPNVKAEADFSLGKGQQLTYQGPHEKLGHHQGTADPLA